VSSPKNLLAHVPAYIALQRGLGADRLRHRCLAESDIRVDETVVDVGCGPAYYFDRLPQPITYVGFDTDERYIHWARRRYGDRATFHVGTFDQEHAALLPPVDVVLLLGLLHHLSDEEARALLHLAGGVLAPGGRVVSVDTCFADGQGRVSRWISNNDRGEHVRPADGFVALARGAFESVDSTLLLDTLRVPAAFCMMRMTGPLDRSNPTGDARPEH
jgi:SAM-dependent methyltransferase